jgi:hypothetical protein
VLKRFQYRLGQQDGRSRLWVKPLWFYVDTNVSSRAVGAEIKSGSVGTGQSAHAVKFGHLVRDGPFHSVVGSIANYVGKWLPEY